MITSGSGLVDKCVELVCLFFFLGMTSYGNMIVWKYGWYNFKGHHHKTHQIIRSSVGKLQKLISYYIRSTHHWETQCRSVS